MMMMMLLVLVFFLQAVSFVTAGIEPFDLLLEPTDRFVHYNDGFIRAPGSIDITDLTFTVTETISYVDDDDEGYDDADYGDDDGGGADVWEEEEKDGDGEVGFVDGIDVEGFDDDGRRRVLRKQQLPNQQPVQLQQLVRRLDDAYDESATDVDIAVFMLPSTCAHNKNGCDWTELGVGKRTPDGEDLRWCCSDEAGDLGLCDTSDHNAYGRLMIDNDKYTGETRHIVIPREGSMEKRLSNPLFPIDKSGTYVTLYANCNTRGRELLVVGNTAWKSKHGYLPGELFGFLYFYMIVLGVYALLTLVYGVSMKMNEGSRIAIENWVFVAIALGLLEMVFRIGDYLSWNADGHRSVVVIWLSILIGVGKQGISRCLIVMVSLGWGVVRDSLGSTMRMIVALGTIYIGASATKDLLIVFAVEDMNKLSYETEQELFSVVRFVTMAVAVVDVVFIMWILDALNNTMLYLENMNQSRKLERFLKLRCYFLFSVMFATMWAVFTLVDTVNEDGIVQEEHAWAIDAAGEVNYLFVLMSVAYLWRPNPAAREYAYVMELPAMGSSADGGTELELTGNIPSAMDDDDDDDQMTDFTNGKKQQQNGGFHD